MNKHCWAGWSKSYSTSSSIPPPSENQPPDNKSKGNIGSKSPITWRSLGITTVLGTGLLCFMWYIKQEKDDGNNLFYLYFIKKFNL